MIAAITSLAIFWGLLFVIATPGAPAKFLDVGRRIRSMERANYLTAAPVEGIAEVLWDQSVLDTDEFIERIDRELKREQWALIPSGRIVERRPDVCPWGVYHDPEFERCECWDPGQ